MSRPSSGAEQEIRIESAFKFCMSGKMGHNALLDGVGAESNIEPVRLERGPVVQ